MERIYYDFFVTNVDCILGATIFMNLSEVLQVLVGASFGYSQRMRSFATGHCNDKQWSSVVDIFLFFRLSKPFLLVFFELSNPWIRDNVAQVTKITN